MAESASPDQESTMPHLANTLYAAAALPLRCLPAAQRLTAITAVLVQCLALGACGGGSTATDSAVVTLSLQPTSAAARSGTAVTFSVAASGTGLLFRWQLSIDGGLAWNDIAGAIAAEYTVANPSVAMNGYLYRAVVSDALGHATTSSPATLTVTASHAVGEVFHDCTPACPDLVVVAAGSFQMGARTATDVAVAQASPTHTVTLANPFALGRTEVSRAEFARFVTATGHVTDAEKGTGCWASSATAPALRLDATWRNPGFTQGDTEPVVCVSWNDAQAYVAWLNTVAGGVTYRLPTEAEWEYAARAGTTASRYAWGDDLSYVQICTYANGGDQTARAGVPRLATASVAACADGFATTAPADGLPANAFGLRHMVGNAWEWVQDGWHASYAGAPADGSAWAP
ncbi:MAG: hypothetical protein CFE32_18790, partial [Alphaproteobacteria bacterium PA3]